MTQHSTDSSTLIHQALNDLVEVAREAGFATDSAWIYALGWLAAGRLAITGKWPGVGSLGDLLGDRVWHSAASVGLPEEVVELIWATRASLQREHGTRGKALIIIESISELQSLQGWDVADAVWNQSHVARPSALAGSVYSPELCELLFDLLMVPSQSTIWIPFDPSGQLVLRALRRGLRVIADGPGPRNNLYVRLLLAIENPAHFPSAVTFALDSPHTEMRCEEIQANRRVFEVDYLLSVPPLGMKLQSGLGWRGWEGFDANAEHLYGRFGPITQVQLDRSDAWSVVALWPRVRHRATFLLSPNVLFAKGQEQRLREYLLFGQSPVVAVTTLPPRQLDTSSVTAAVLLLDRKHVSDNIRFVDGSGMTIDSKSSMRYARVLNNKRISNLMLGQSDDSKHAADIELDQIIVHDFNLVPARYIRRSLSDAGPRKLLGELVSVVRAPVSSKEPTAVNVQEVGIPELDRWRPIIGPLSKSVSIHARKLEESMLREGDIVLSIKGTLGKSGILGLVPTPEVSLRAAVVRAAGSPIYLNKAEAPVVPSQSCIALRVRSDRITARFLLLYLRSDEFKHQIDALRVGAVIAHVTPATLVQHIQVPAPPLSEQRDYVRRYDELCKLEATVEEATQRSEEIRKALWPAGS